MSAPATDAYYVPTSSNWPIIASISLATLAIGTANFMNGYEGGSTLLIVGFAILIFMMFGWFRDVIIESEQGLYNAQVDMSFRWGMGWFIFSEVMFFAAFFGALFYARVLSIPWLGGAGAELTTQELLWPNFQAIWPLLETPGAASVITKTEFSQASQVVGAWGLPAINTALLLTSGWTCTMAHWALKVGNRKGLILWLFATVSLGFIFVGLQAMEYSHAMHEYGLTMASGIYGSTFYMLTGFHGFHVTMGAIILTVIMFRAMKGHFSDHNHFAFEAAAWYWHFVDVVWLGLFIFVYWI